MRQFLGIRLFASLLMAISLAGSVWAAELDHLKGYKTKDLNQVPVPANPYTVGDETCNLIRPLYVLKPTAKNDGDDPRGGPVTDFLCYKARCSGGPFPPYVLSTEADSQFGTHKLERRRTKIVCLPIDNDVCGDNDIDPGEQCDGTDADACPGYCDISCHCPPAPCPSSGGNSLACQSYTTNLICAICCQSQGCSACATAAASSCTNPSENDLCGAEANALGCALYCCNEVP